MYRAEFLILFGITNIVHANIISITEKELQAGTTSGGIRFFPKCMVIFNARINSENLLLI